MRYTMIFYVLQYVYQKCKKNVILFNNDYGYYEIIRRVNYIDKCNEVVKTYDDDDFVIIDIEMIE